MTLQLRPYQSECLAAIHDNYRQGVNRQLIHLPTAAGKTVIFSHLIGQLQRKTLVLAHTTELLDQASNKIKMICPNLDVGIVKAGRRELDKPVVVSSIQSARQSGTLDEFKKLGFGLCVYDETHRAGSASGREVLSALGFFEKGEKLLCGFSATPFRNDGKGLGEVFEKVVYRKTVKELIALGYLCPPKGIRIKTDLDLSAVTSDDGDFAATSLASVMDTPELRELVVDSYVEHATGRKAIAFAVDIAHAQHLADAFNARGIRSAAINGGMSEKERISILAAFKRGEIAVLCNCMILVEGFDESSIDCVIVARPTQSKGLYIQMAGRGLRLFPLKRDCLILDFGSKSHSLSSAATLTKDDTTEAEEKKTKADYVPEFAKGLPPTLNQKLKAAVIAFDPLSDAFSWAQEGEVFALKGFDGTALKIIPTGTAEGRYNVIFLKNGSAHKIARDLTFEYAFGCSEEWAKENRSMFLASDLTAPWRCLPISDRQMSVLRSFGYSSGIQDLTRGQASVILQSGILKKKTLRA